MTTIGIYKNLLYSTLNGAFNFGYTGPFLVRLLNENHIQVNSEQTSSLLIDTSKDLKVVSYSYSATFFYVVDSVRYAELYTVMNPETIRSGLIALVDFGENLELNGDNLTINFKNGVAIFSGNLI